MNVIEAISTATVLEAEEAVFAKLQEFFRLAASTAKEQRPYLNDEALRTIAKGCVRITLGYLESGLDVALASVLLGDPCR